MADPLSRVWSDPRPISMSHFSGASVATFNLLEKWWSGRHKQSLDVRLIFLTSEPVMYVAFRFLEPNTWRTWCLPRHIWCVQQDRSEMVQCHFITTSRWSNPSYVFAFKISQTQTCSTSGRYEYLKVPYLVTSIGADDDSCVLVCGRLVVVWNMSLNTSHSFDLPLSANSK